LGSTPNTKQANRSRWQTFQTMPTWTCDHIVQWQWQHLNTYNKVSCPNFQSNRLEHNVQSKHLSIYASRNLWLK
jgi:hypothetical protein